MILCDREIEAISVRQEADNYEHADSDALLAEVKRLRRWAGAGMLAALVREDGDKLRQVAERFGELLDEDADLLGCRCRWCREDGPRE